MGQTIVDGIISAVVGGIILALLVKWGRALLNWSKDKAATIKSKYLKARERRESSKLATLRRKVIVLAQDRNILLPVSSNRRDPAIVKYTDDSVHYYFSDFERYRHALQHRNCPPLRTRIGRAPLPVSRWDRPALEKWLQEHTD